MGVLELVFGVGRNRDGKTVRKRVREAVSVGVGVAESLFKISDSLAICDSHFQYTYAEEVDRGLRIHWVDEMDGRTSVSALPDLYLRDYTLRTNRQFSEALNIPRLHEFLW